MIKLRIGVIDPVKLLDPLCYIWNKKNLPERDSIIKKVDVIEVEIGKTRPITIESQETKKVSPIDTYYFPITTFRDQTILKSVLQSK